MPHIAHNYSELIGSSIGNGQCVALVRECAGLPPTSRWRRGAPARGSLAAPEAGQHDNLARGLSPSPGTCVATFDDNARYGNHTDGRSHAAILVAEEETGLRVVDQWVGRKPLPGVQERVIRFKDGAGLPVDDGSQYYCIELAT